MDPELFSQQKGVFSSTAPSGAQRVQELRRTDRLAVSTLGCVWLLSFLGLQMAQKHSLKNHKHKAAMPQMLLCNQQQCFCQSYFFLGLEEGGLQKQRCAFYATQSSVQRALTSPRARSPSLSGQSSSFAGTNRKAQSTEGL